MAVIHLLDALTAEQVMALPTARLTSIGWYLRLPAVGTACSLVQRLSHTYNVSRRFDGSSARS